MSAVEVRSGDDKAEERTGWMIVFPGRADVSERQAERSGEELREAGEDESMSREAEQHEASPGREEGSGEEVPVRGSGREEMDSS